MCDYANEFNQMTKEGTRFIPVILKAYKILRDIRKKEGKQGFYKLNIGDVLFVALDIFDKLLNDEDGEFVKKLQQGEDIDGILKIKDKSIDKYLNNYEEVLRMAISLAKMEKYFKEGN